ncbi:hypothetical protein [Zhihengliuella flava]|uniref:Helix-turn-helix DNA binding domain protein n=1 Tax=Zhihengliuella flava TaxID=1285193 RepID=A0A931DE66_9MICC|nr:hypothetical protein [Zhihengliuella flava]MBG6085826.1 hypothetical protein [Zhihengliuella flava]
MTQCTNTECGAEASQYLCQPCTGRLRGHLFRVPSTIATADATRLGMAVGVSSEGGGGGKAGSCSPGSDVIREHLETYRVTLVGWARALAETSHETAPVDTIPAAEWLTRRLVTIIQHDWAGDLLYELRAAERDILRASDRPTERVTLGECGRPIYSDGRIQPCPGTVKHYEGATYARCDMCSQAYDAVERRTQRIVDAHHVIAPLPQVVRALQLAGYKVKYNTAHKWVQRGKLTPRRDPNTNVEGVSPADLIKLMK